MEVREWHKDQEVNDIIIAVLDLQGKDPERNRLATEMVLATYIGEPCTICGVPMTRDALNESRWTGYNKESTGRVCHEECWNSCFGGAG